MSGEGEPGLGAAPTPAAGDLVGGDKIAIGVISGAAVAAGRGATAIQAGGDVTLNYAELAYDVRGLPNPYLGLRPFGYGDRASYAGRERGIAQALAALTGPGEERTLLFITGASGSGKSSFVQAGLIPALEEFYAARAAQTRYALMRPSRQPLNMLADALLQLGLPVRHPRIVEGLAQPGILAGILSRYTPPGQVGLLVIDQFEELFTQSDPAQCEALLGALEALPPFAQIRTQIVATLRSDFLPELFDHQGIYELVKRGIDLRAMRPEELCLAITRPLERAFPDGEKRFEDALLSRLAEDASGDAAYLPLLQATLEDLWRRGSLKLAAYGDLGDAIRQRAEEVYRFADYDGARAQPRGDAERLMIMGIFLDLVEVAFDDATHRDVRRRRTAEELSGGDAERERLVNDLSAARLLSKGSEQRGERQVETVDIIHERLIGGWERLRTAIDERRAGLRRRARFEQALRDWEAGGRSADYMLEGVWLAEAEALDREGDVALRGEPAQALLKASVAAREAEVQQELEQARRLADEASARERAEQEARAQAERRAEEQARSSARLRQRAIFLGGALAVALIAMGAAGWFAVRSSQNARDAEFQTGFAFSAQKTSAARAVEAEEARNQALRREREAEGQALAGEALAELERRNFDRALLLARASVVPGAVEQPQLVNSALRRALQDIAPSRLLADFGSADQNSVIEAHWSADGQRLLLLSSGAGGFQIDLLEAASGERLHSITIGEESGESLQTTLSPDGRTVLVAAKLASRAPEQSRASLLRYELDETLTPQERELPYERVDRLGWRPDGAAFFVVGSADNSTQLWDLASMQPLREIPASVRDWSPDGRLLSATITSRAENGAGETFSSLAIFDAANGQAVAGLDSSTLEWADWSPDGQWALIYDTGQARALFWNIASGLTTDVITNDEDDFLSVPSDVLQDLSGSRSAVSWVVPATLLIGGGDGVARIWDMRASNWVLEQPVIADRLVGPGLGGVLISWSPNGRRVLAASDAARLWDLGEQISPVLPVTLGGPEGYAAATWLAPDGGRIAVVTGLSGSSRVWEWRNGVSALSTKLAGNAFAWHPDGRRVAVSDGNAVRIVDIASGTTLALLELPSVYEFAWSPDGAFLLAANENRLELWNIAELRVVQRFAGIGQPVYQFVWSPDGRSVLSSDDLGVRIWDVASGALRHSFGLSSSFTLAWHPDGTQALAGGDDGKLYILDVASGKLARPPLAAHTDWVSAAAWSPDGRYLLTGGRDGVARIWDAASGRLIESLEDHGQIVWQASWSPDGQQFLTGGFDGTIRLHLFDKRLIVAELTRRLCYALDDATITATIPEWRGCAAELAAAEGDLQAYDALRRPR
jgi:WD40 repeat protein